MTVSLEEHVARASRRAKASGIWTRDPHDFYVEPEWVSKRLFEEELFHGTVIDPACGTGRIVVSALASGLVAGGLDIVAKRGFLPALDFLDQGWGAGLMPPPNIVCNPPFGVADEFVRLAIERALDKVAMLLPATWHFGSKRAAWLEHTPLKRVLACTPRPSMPPGAVILAGEKPGGGKKDFSWYIWERGHKGPWTGGWLHRDKTP